jgi:acyl-CoA thioester hydrolase
VHEVTRQAPAEPVQGRSEREVEPHVRNPTQVRVRFADTDAAGIVHYATYLAYFEAGRAEALRQLGLPQTSIVACGLHAPVQEATLRYRTPARFDDLLLVRTWATEIARQQFRFAYEVLRIDDQALIATGETLHSWTDAQPGGPTDTPDWLLAALEQLRDVA